MTKKRPAELSISPRLLTITAAAKYMSTTVWQMRTLGWERRIATIKLGKRLLFDVHDLDAFVEQHKTAAVIGEREAQQNARPVRRDRSVGGA